MTLAGTPILPRSGEARSEPLTSGAIAGIVCGIGALFLSAAVLFIIYYHRQQRYAQEDDADAESYDDAAPRPAAGPVVRYTMDYKMDNPNYQEASPYMYSSEKAPYVFFQQSIPDVDSAMPTHPAYIPRALVRGSATPTNRSVATTSPPPYPASVSRSSRIQPDDGMIGGYPSAPAQSGPSTQSQENTPEESDGPSSSASTTTRPGPLPSVSDAEGSSRSDRNDQQRNRWQRQGQEQEPEQQQKQQKLPSPYRLQPPPKRRKRRAYTPPRLNLAEGTPQHRSRTERPLAGKEHTTISGPLAFPQFSYPAVMGPSPPPPGQSPPGPSPPGASPPGPSPPGPSPPGQPWSTTAGWQQLREDDSGAAAAADIWDGEGEEQWYSQPSPPSDARRAAAFRNRISWTSITGSGSGSNSGKDKKKHSRKKSDRNSGGFGGNRHYTEIEIGRGSDIW